ncbi:ester cyclase [Stigmatella aurantiaca]|uniref:ester cyclase n=1 Tax=Stigmatella aurantiaca TaxID=41 RepID=UPI0009F712D2
MNTEQAREFYQQYLDTLYHERRLSEFPRFFHESLVVHPPFPGELSFAGVRGATQMLVEGFSDFRVTPGPFLYADNMIAARLTVTGTHTGPYMGIPPTGKKIQAIAHTHYRLHEGKIAELWDCTDALSLLQQLGVLPPMP